MFKLYRKKTFYVLIGLIYLISAVFDMYNENIISTDTYINYRRNRVFFIGNVNGSGRSLDKDTFLGMRSDIQTGGAEMTEAEVVEQGSVTSYLIQDKTDQMFQKWESGKQTFCSQHFIGYANTFVHLKDIVINPAFSKSRAGGEDLTSVMRQPESYEYIKMYPGYFTMPCSENLKYKFNKKDHLLVWQKKVLNKDDTKLSTLSTETRFTVAVQRYEYVNMYHTMTDWYSVFLMCLFFGKEPGDTNILWIDAHPKGSLDQVWETLFGTITRAGQFKLPVLYKDMVWPITGYFAPLSLHDLKRVPYLEEFRKFFLNQHGIQHEHDIFDCNKLRVLFIWRRDYVAHARNPNGMIKRKFHNEDELLNAIQISYPGYVVEGLQMDTLSMRDQLEKIAKTDVLIGMHGAGLSLALFLPKHAGLIEFYPKYWPTANKHFKTFARWRDLHYVSWQNKIKEHEKPNFFTNIPSDIMLEKFKYIQSKICMNRQ